ncbi:uncharacterized protein LOC112452704 [Temnothorax curvispinosus]|uniref:Uncharacterized protein LOC112452704 n=1 Tax=Temnothorax curvispinosus TaxID=300111 RepID=A0A6J1PHS9_9HYME|nr:uncharacterized protein LOC112452704 [Temnothorax curvispinosus]
MFRGKLSPKAQKLIFIGYANGSKAYRLLDKQKGKITISRNVTFVGEEDFGNTSNDPDEKIVPFEQEQEQNVPRTDKTIVITSDEESFENAGEDNDEDQDGEDEELKRLSRRNKGRPPDRFAISDHANMVSTFIVEPRRYRALIKKNGVRP